MVFVTGKEVSASYKTSVNSYRIATTYLTPLYTNNITKTRNLLQTTGGKNEPNIVYMRKPYRTLQHGTKNVKHIIEQNGGRKQIQLT